MSRSLARRSSGMSEQMGSFDEAAAPDEVEVIEEEKTTVSLSSFVENNEGWLKFLPTMLVWPIWLYVMGNGNHWSDVFEDYWPMTIAMILGSFIAGSTPLGGGIVAFPVSVLVLSLTASEARDISVLIQSVGMNAASYLIFLTKPEFLIPEFIVVFSLTGIIGILIGLASEPEPSTINLSYTILVFEFGVIFFYTNVMNPINKIHQMAELTGDGPLGSGDLAKWVGRVMIVIFGISGGLITSTTGTGCDVLLFLYGLYIWNILYPTERYSENCFTASSVVVMGIVSFATAVIRALDGGFTEESLFTWGAMIPIVVIGAPLGSIIISSDAIPYLRILFYFLAVFQFIMFSALKIKDESGQWLAVIIVTALVIIALNWHYHWYCDQEA